MWTKEVWLRSPNHLPRAVQRVNNRAGISIQTVKARGNLLQSEVWALEPDNLGLNSSSVT